MYNSAGGAARVWASTSPVTVSSSVDMKDRCQWQCGTPDLSQCYTPGRCYYHRRMWGTERQKGHTIIPEISASINRPHINACNTTVFCRTLHKASDRKRSSSLGPPALHHRITLTVGYTKNISYRLHTLQMRWKAPLEYFTFCPCVYFENVAVRLYAG